MAENFPNIFVDVDGYVKRMEEKLESVSTYEEAIKLQNEINDVDNKYAESTEMDGWSNKDREKLDKLFDKAVDISDKKWKKEHKKMEPENSMFNQFKRKHEESQKQETVKETPEQTIEEDTKIDEKLSSLLSERAQVLYQLTILKARRFENGIEDSIKSKVDGMREYLSKQAKIYGQNKEKYEAVMREYNDALTQAHNEYTKTRTRYVNAQSQHEEWENNSIIGLRTAKKAKKEYMESDEYKNVKKEYRDTKKELVNSQKYAIKAKEFDEAKKLQADIDALDASCGLSEYDEKIKSYKSQISDARQGIKSFKQKIKELEENYDIELEGIDEKNGQQLAEIKQSTFGKIVGSLNSILKKINGNTKFKNEVLKPIKEKTTHIITETIPKIGIGIADGVKSVPGNVKSIADKVKTAKEKAINKFKESIKEANKRDRDKLAEMKKNDKSGTQENEEVIDEEK